MPLSQVSSYPDGYIHRTPRHVAGAIYDAHHSYMDDVPQTDPTSSFAGLPSPATSHRWLPGLPPDN